VRVASGVAALASVGTGLAYSNGTLDAATLDTRVGTLETSVGTLTAANLISRVGTLETTVGTLATSASVSALTTRVAALEGVVSGSGSGTVTAGTVRGGTASSASLAITSTSHGTKGVVSIDASKGIGHGASVWWAGLDISGTASLWGGSGGTDFQNNGMVHIAQPTIAKLAGDAGTYTVSRSATFVIAGPPVAGSGVSLTGSQHWSLQVATGSILIGSGSPGVSDGLIVLNTGTAALTLARGSSTHFRFAMDASNATIKAPVDLTLERGSGSNATLALYASSISIGSAYTDTNVSAGTRSGRLLITANGGTRYIHIYS
jgi:hypothetical protein